MRIPAHWLEQFLKQSGVRDLSDVAEKLTAFGMEVEREYTAAPPFSAVVVAKVLAVEPHPNADALSICQVAVAQPSPVSIVCGAKNVAAGICVPCALPGAQLPGGVHIRLAKIRGQESQGMLCAGRELGLGDDGAGLLILPASFEVDIGKDLRQVLGLDEIIYELKLTPDMSHAMSVLGVARALATVMATEFREPSWDRTPVTVSSRLAVTVDAPSLCGRFAARVIQGVNANVATPEWIKQRLERAGQRSVGVLVDLSNYVMLERGSPSHVFDLDKISGGLQVRFSREGESFLALGHTDEWLLGANTGVVADQERVLSLAGIIGGQVTAVSERTQNIFVEMAFWWPEAIAGRARAYGISTEASARFERGVDFSKVADHLDYLSHLIISICGGQAGPVDDQIVNLPTRADTTFPPAMSTH